MTVAELIMHLNTLPQENTVGIYWDGRVRSSVEGIILEEKRVVLVSLFPHPSFDIREFPEEQIIYRAPVEDE